MPCIVSLVAIVGGSYFRLNRMRNAAHLAEMAQDVPGAARRFGFRRQASIHPADSLHDAKVAMAAVGIGYLELSGLPRAEQHDALLRALQVNLDMSPPAAEAAVVPGR